MKKNIYKYLAGNDYPGRGIVLGKSPDGQKAFVAYWIMGRSANSRNRVFEPIDGGIRTVAADPAKLEDPHLIIYNAVLTLRETTVVTNGDQTDTIARFMNGNLFPGYSFEAALATRTYEDDAPNFTPRISGVVDMRRGGYKLSIVKSDEGNAESVQRQTFDYPQPVAGEGHFISTYVKNGAPIPSFAGEPLRVAIDTNDADKFADKLWASLNEDNKVSDGIIAPGYDADALEVLKSKKKGGYAIVQIDADYEPKPLETRTVFGVTFEQGRQDLDISNETMLQNVVTENKVISDEQRRDLIISLIVLKYTQSNSVCYVQDGQTIGVGAGQQSRVHCTRLAGQKADNWQLRHMPKVLDLPFRADIAKPNRDNAIDVYIGDTPEDVIGDDVWAETFTEQPAPLTAEEKRAWLDAVTGVSLGSDAFFPFGDNIERARRSGVTAIVQPGGSIRDAQVIDTCNKYGIAMAFCGIRLFHH